MKKLYIISLVFFLLISLTFLYNYLNQKNLDQYQKLKVEFENGNRIDCYIADSYYKQKLGLSGLFKLNQKEGMLFKYEYSVPRSVWTKEMNFAIDVIWLDNSSKLSKEI